MLVSRFVCTDDSSKDSVVKNIAGMAMRFLVNTLHAASLQRKDPDKTPAECLQEITRWRICNGEQPFSFQVGEMKLAQPGRVFWVASTCTNPPTLNDFYVVIHVRCDSEDGEDSLHVVNVNVCRIDHPLRIDRPVTVSLSPATLDAAVEALLSGVRLQKDVMNRLAPLWD